MTTLLLYVGGSAVHRNTIQWSVTSAAKLLHTGRNVSNLSNDEEIDASAAASGVLTTPTAMLRRLQLTIDN